MTSLIATATLAFVLCSLAGDAEARKPVIEDVIVTDYAPPPASPAAMASEAAAVVVAKYTGKSRFVLRSSPGVPAPPFTSHAFEITSFVKFHPWLPNVGGQFEIRLPGGDEEFPTHIRRTKSADGETLIRNNAYVVVLAFNYVRDELYLAWGPAGLYDVTREFVRGVGLHNAQHDDKTVAAFLVALRAPLQ